MQIKAEDKILGDVLSALRSIADIATHVQGSCKSLQSKQELTQLLIENERSRLRVWLSPLEPERKHHIPSIGGKNSSDVGDPCSAFLILWMLMNPLGHHHLSPTCMGRVAWSGNSALCPIPIDQDADRDPVVDSQLS